jgi:hypothetical protein
MKPCCVTLNESKEKVLTLKVDRVGGGGLSKKEAPFGAYKYKYSRLCGIRQEDAQCSNEVPVKRPFSGF